MTIRGVEDQLDVSQNHILVGQIYTRLGQISTPPARRDGLHWTHDRTATAKDKRLPLYYKGSGLLNEVVQRIVIVEGERAEDYSLWRRSASEVIAVRTLHETDAMLNTSNCFNTKNIGFLKSEFEIKRTESLTCRWVETITYNGDGKIKQESLTRPQVLQDTRPQTSQASTLRATCHGHRIPSQADEGYTFSDAFCGGGGMSSGAQSAGASVKLSFDIDAKKIATHSANFPNCKSMAKSADEFINLARGKSWRTAILHLSPPCQPYSPVNTTPNVENDAKNQAALLACTQIIEALRPRIVTVEETPGIHKQKRHRDWLHALLNQFTELGFSLRWAELKCAEFGVPQLRKRLFIIAAAPGEALPPFPEPTHEYGEITIQHALDKVARAHARQPLSHHDVDNTYDTPKPRHKANALAKTITCGGGENYHPDGTRPYTARELLALQTFPVDYKCGKIRDKHGQDVELCKSEFVRQIGNAVPPAVGKAIIKEVIKSLQDTDRQRAPCDTAEATVIDLTED